MLAVQQNLQSAYLLHSRHYRNTSLLLDIYTRNHGRMGVVAKGVCKPKSGLASVLQVFQPLLISWYGRGELVTLTHAESICFMPPLTGTALFAGLYLNELLVRLLPQHDAHPDLFDHYHQAMQALASAELSIEYILRRFEKNLLRELGFALDFLRELTSHAPVIPEKFYSFSFEQGVRQVESATAIHSAQRIFAGKRLLALAADDYADPAVLYDAKLIFREAIAILLDGKPLKTRELFS